jgi:hypothetical protein
MEWVILESVVALALGIAIVWWTFAPSRKRDRDGGGGNNDNRAANAACAYRQREPGDGGVERPVALGKHLVAAFIVPTAVAG